MLPTAALPLAPSLVSAGTAPTDATGAAMAPLPLPMPLAQKPSDIWFGQNALEHWGAAVAAPGCYRVRRHAKLVHEGAPAHHVYIVQAGDFKVSRTAEDGYEQILDFPGWGDMLGLDALARRRCETTIEALQDATVYAIPLTDLPALRAGNPVFEARIQAALSEQWMRVRDIAWLMSAVGADRRTARFLLQLSHRMESRRQSPRRLRLLMSRRDIAGHLGLAHESISRAMTALAAAGYIAVDYRDVEILDLPGLERFARSTRGHAEPDSLPERGALPLVLPSARRPGRAAVHVGH